MALRIGLTTLVIIAALSGRPLLAQQTTGGTPLSTAGHSFHENIGFTWGLQGNGWFFNSPGLAPPPFGAGGGGASLGGGFGWGGLRLVAEQGASTTMSSQSPSVTVMNGGTGYFSDTTIRPFVTGLFPVVGNMPRAPALPTVGGNNINPVLERLARLEAEGRLAAPAAPVDKAKGEREAPPLALGGAVLGGPSSAERGDLSVAEIKARRAAAAPDQEAEVAACLAKAQAAEADGKPGVARVYYEMAARRATGDRQQQILVKLRELTEK